MLPDQLKLFSFLLFLSMDRYPFHYRKTALHLQLLLVFGLFALLLFYFSFQSFRRFYQTTGADHQVFAWIGSAMGLTGLLFLVFGVWYYLLIHRFFNRPAWYGVEITASTISCTSFDFIRKQYWQVPLSAIRSVRPGSYKGRRYLSLVTDEKPFNIPVNNMESHDLERLTRHLQQLIT